MTDVNAYNSLTGEWNDSLNGESLWSNVNLSEAVPDVMMHSAFSITSRCNGR